MKQLVLLKGQKLSSEHGGRHSIGKRKSKRYISTKKPMHLVMRASCAAGAMSFRQRGNYILVSSLIAKYARYFGVKLYEVGIESNHFHLVARSKDRKAFQDFQRTLAGQVAAKITKASRGKPFGKFWDKLSFTKVVEWGRQFFSAKRYVRQNELEASGAIPYTPRKRQKPDTPGR